jgi:hypothetical protein
MAHHQPVRQVARPLGHPIMPQGIVTQVMTVFTPHLSGNSIAQQGDKRTAATPIFTAGRDMSIHTISRGDWVIQVNYARNRNNPFARVVSSQGSSLPSGLVIGDYNGLQVEDARDIVKYNVCGVSQNVYKGNEAPGVQMNTDATSSESAITVAVRGTATVKCITRERLEPGDYFGVKAPDDDDLVSIDPNGVEKVEVVYFRSHVRDKVVPVMYKIRYDRFINLLYEGLSKRGPILTGIGGAPGHNWTGVTIPSAPGMKVEADLPPGGNAAIRTQLFKMAGHTDDGHCKQLDYIGAVMREINRLAATPPIKPTNAAASVVAQVIKNSDYALPFPAEKTTAAMAAYMLLLGPARAELNLEAPMIFMFYAIKIHTAYIKEQDAHRKGKMITSAPVGGSQPDVFLL